VYSLVAIGRPSFVCCYVWNYTRTHWHFHITSQ